MTLRPVTLTLIRAGNRTIEVPAEPTDSPDLVIAPTIAVRDEHLTYTGDWNIVHVPTGKTIRMPATCLTHTRRAAADLAASGVDWHRDRTALNADPAARAAHQAARQYMAYCCGCGTA
jgi:hypothetical protein